jgi:UDP-N-acetylglucosamine 2-epimerase (non-hydrolysing)
MGRVTFVVAARPNFMKVEPVLRAFRALGRHETVLVHTGQHYDASMSDVFLAELGFPTPDVFLEVGSGTHAEQTARALERIERNLLDTDSDAVVVAGDVNSTLAGALAASKIGVPVVHLEAGLRSGDMTMPEEVNRILTDRLSDLLLTHSPEAIDNLAREGIAPEKVQLVGNTMIDSLLANVDRAIAARPWAELGVTSGEYGLVTLHRPALVDDDALLAATVRELRRVAEAVPLVFCVHPRTRRRLEHLELLDDLAGSDLIVTPPLGYITFLGLEAQAAFVLTDSGGVQEETSALGVRCFTLRDSTERPVTVTQGTNTLLGARPDAIADVLPLLDDTTGFEPIPLWDGQAGIRAAQAIDDFVSDLRPRTPTRDATSAA